MKLLLDNSAESLCLGFLALNEVTSWTASFPSQNGSNVQRREDVRLVICENALPDLLARLFSTLDRNDQSLNLEPVQVKKIRERLAGSANTYRIRLSKASEPAYFGLLRIALDAVLVHLGEREKVIHF